MRKFLIALMVTISVAASANIGQAYATIRLPLPVIWKTYTIKDYSFSYPPSWTTEASTSGRPFGDQQLVRFFDASGTRIATVYCPPLETGYEAWYFKDTVRYVYKNKSVYRLMLSEGTPIEPALGPLVVINMLRNTPGVDSRTDSSDWQNSCVMISGEAYDGSQVDSFRKIYNSIRFL